MSPEAADWWARSLLDLESAAKVLPFNPDLAAAAIAVRAERLIG